MTSWKNSFFSILIQHVLHPLLSKNHIKAVPNHYFTAGLDMFLPTFYSFKWIALAQIGSWVAIGDFSIWVQHVWHPHPSVDHIKAVKNHYSTAGLPYFLATLNLGVIFGTWSI